MDLPLRYRRNLEGLLREYVPDAEVWAYGSRIAGESHEGSDLDLVVRDPELKPLRDSFFQLLEAIEQSNIPILLQAHDWARLPVSFHVEIERDYVVVKDGFEAASRTRVVNDQLGRTCKVGIKRRKQDHEKSLRGYESAEGSLIRSMEQMDQLVDTTSHSVHTQASSLDSHGGVQGCPLLA